MLKKSVCKACINAAALAKKLQVGADNLSWTEEDDKRWLKGHLFCPFYAYPRDIRMWGKIQVKKAFNICKRKSEHTGRKNEEG